MNEIDYFPSPVGSKVIQPYLKTASHLSDDEYKTIVIPTLIKLFGSTDRSIRLSLLEGLPFYIHHLSERTLNEVIFQHVASGFTDASPVVREQTVKSMVHLASKVRACYDHRKSMVSLSFLFSLTERLLFFCS
jgi:SCY1-like protein 1